MRKFCYLVGVVLMMGAGACDTTGKKYAADVLVIKHIQLEPATGTCFFDGADAGVKNAAITIDTASVQETRIMNAIMGFTGLPQNFKLYRGNINRAIATSVNKQRVIIYNKALFQSMGVLDSAYWSAMFILAHEIGHHLAYNLSDTAGLATAELQADMFAGALLFKMGADSNQVTAVFYRGVISESDANKNRPSITKRMAVVKQSWQDAAQLRYHAVIPPPMDDDLKVHEFTERNLIFNAVGNSYFDAYPVQGQDSLLLLDHFGLLKHIGGTVLQVREVTGNNDYASEVPSAEFVEKTKNVTRLKVDVLVTSIDTTGQHVPAPFEADHNYGFDIFYEARVSTDRVKDLFNFFKPGRQFSFSVINLRRETGDAPAYVIVHASAF